MTALDGLERLESPGLWRPGPGEQRRDVYVTVGDAELVIEDRAGAPLSHWSLPALVRLNPRAHPALYAPDDDSGEQLEIEETEMIAALDRVMRAVEQGRSRPWALRRIILVLGASAALGLAVFWLPGALRTQAATIIPAAQRAEIGTQMLAGLTALTGPACADPAGAEALDDLRERLFPLTPLRLLVLRDLPVDAVLLPGGLLILSDRVLSRQDDPDVAAGHLVAAATRATGADPLESFLSAMGFPDLIRMLVTGEVPRAAITRHVERLIVAAPPAVAPKALRPAFAAAQVDWTAYARANALPEGEVAAPRMPPAMDDTPWQALREICSR